MNRSRTGLPASRARSTGGRGPLDPALAAAVTAAISTLPEMVVSPPLWPNR
ncbi:MAG: hypothetical protein ACKOEX_08445 [Planctomycetia bacterium]